MQPEYNIREELEESADFYKNSPEAALKTSQADLIESKFKISLAVDDSAGDDDPLVQYYKL